MNFETVQSKHFPIRVPARSQMWRHLKDGGEWQPFVAHYLVAMLEGVTDKEEIVCVDAGARVGYYTLLLAPLCAGVIAFESNKEMQAVFRDNMALNGIENFTLIEQELGNGGNAFPLDGVLSGVGVDVIRVGGKSVGLDALLGAEYTVNKYQPVMTNYVCKKCDKDNVLEWFASKHYNVNEHQGHVIAYPSDSIMGERMAETSTFEEKRSGCCG